MNQITLRNLIQLKKPSLIGLLLYFVFANSYASTPVTPLPEMSTQQHNGVASCASSTCHGKVASVDGHNVMQNEYHLWSTKDPHSHAYQTLLSPASKAIANNLNLPNASTAPACLGCHSDNVPAERRALKFKISDGVGCEACHGGSEFWLKKHTEPGATHASNITAGLYPTENPYARARLCISCHIGTKNKFADHEMMAAGHPRLTFELETFTANQTQHYTIDTDYKTRKGQPSVGHLWVAGQIESSKSLLTLIDTHAATLTSKTFAIYDCHGCHSPMKANGAAQKNHGLALGSPRLLDYSFDMVSAVFNVLMPTEKTLWQQAISQLQLSTQTPTKLSSSTHAMRTSLSALENQLNTAPLSTAQVKSIRLQIIEMGGMGTFDDFTSAEQAFLAIESLSYSIGDHDAVKTALDALYKTLSSEYDFDSKKFRQALASLKLK